MFQFGLCCLSGLCGCLPFASIKVFLVGLIYQYISLLYTTFVDPDPVMAAGGMSLDNPAFRSFIGYAAVVLLKTVLMSGATAFYRITKKVFASDEDVSYFKVNKKGMVLNDPDVERVRRAHLNDLENILPFVLLGAIYCTTGPVLSTALLHFRIFTAARILHTVVYLLKIPQPARAITFFVGFGVNLSLVYHILMRAAF